MFRQVLEEACAAIGSAGALLRELHADVDHPVAAGHPEGEYLKAGISNAD